MKYIKSISFEYKDNTKQLIVKLTDKECFKFDDVYLIIESYKKKVDIISLWAVDGKSVELTLDPEKTSSYDIKNILEKLV